MKKEIEDEEDDAEDLMTEKEEYIGNGKLNL